MSVNCKNCRRMGTDFYMGLCPQNEKECEELPQEQNYCAYYIDKDSKTNKDIIDMLREEHS